MASRKTDNWADVEEESVRRPRVAKRNTLKKKVSTLSSGQRGEKPLSAKPKQKRLKRDPSDAKLTRSLIQLADRVSSLEHHVKKLYLPAVPDLKRCDELLEALYRAESMLEACNASLARVNTSQDLASKLVREFEDLKKGLTSDFNTLARGMDRLARPEGSSGSLRSRTPELGRFKKQRFLPG